MAGEVALMLWLVVSFCGLLLIAMLLGIFWFVIKRQIILRIYMPDRSIFTKRFFFKKIPKTIDLKELGIYFIDENCMFKTFFGYVLHYTYNNPEPIEQAMNKLQDMKIKDLPVNDYVKQKITKLFNFPYDYEVTASIPTEIKRRAQNIEKFNKDGLVKELFTRDNLIKTLLLLMIISLVASAIILGCVLIPQFNQKDVVKCELANSQNNTMIIANGYKQALKGDSIATPTSR